MSASTEKTIDYYCIILDESGSMFEHTKDTLGSLKQFHASQKDVSHANSKFVVNTFNTKVETRFNGTIGTDLAFNYKPEGSTALYDAIGQTITNTLNYLAKAETKPKDVYMIILTDGEENSSRSYSGDTIRQMIETQKAADWKFIFLAANQDAMFSGNKIGIEKGACLSYAQNKNATPNAFRCVSEGIKRQKAYSNTAVESCQVAFTECERLDATTN
jgi:hypothetical protein